MIKKAAKSIKIKRKLHIPSARLKIYPYHFQNEIKALTIDDVSLPTNYKYVYICMKFRLYHGANFWQNLVGPAMAQFAQ